MPRQPVMDIRSGRAPAQAQEGVRRTGGAALIVEDEPAIADHLAATLARAGFATRVLHDCGRLREHLGGQPDLVVLDVSLPDADAIDVLRLMAVQGFSGEVLLVSGAPTALLRNIWQVGADRGLLMLDPVQKPFRSSEIVRVLTLPRVRPTEASRPADGPSRVAATFDCAEALRSGWLETWYQPKVSTRTGRIVGAECLARVRHPAAGLLGPASFLPSADPDTIADLTARILRQSCRDWPAFAAAGLPLRLAVNVDPITLARPSLLSLLKEAMPVDPRWPGLILEITEDDAVKDLGAIRESAVQLSIYGVAVSLDDFGTGYSNLSRMHELPCHEIKIDRSLVQECRANGKAEAICRAIVAMAEACGTQVVAEGVETESDLARVTRLGCHTAQGFFLGRPMRKEAFLDHWRRACFREDGVANGSG